MPPTRFECHVGDGIKLSDINDVRQKVCGSLPLYGNHDDDDYCILHFPGDKDVDFARIMGTRRGTRYFDFRGVQFSSEFSFSKWKFYGNVDFSHATFSKKVDFSDTLFPAKVSFGNSKFMEDANFEKTIFRNESNFHGTLFKGKVNFSSAIVAKKAFLRFQSTSFHKAANFDGATIRGYLYFADLPERNEVKDINHQNPILSGFCGTDASLQLTNLRLLKPEHLLLNSVRLHPSCFLNTDAKKVILTNINWGKASGTGKGLKEDLDYIPISTPGYKHRFALLTHTFRQLSENAEINNRFEEASKFRRSAFALERISRRQKRIEGRMKIVNILKNEIECSEIHSKSWPKTRELAQAIYGMPYDPISFLYRLSSGYGEKWCWALFLLVLIWLTFGSFYFFFGKFIGSGLSSFSEGLAYSAQVMAFQRPKPFPAPLLTTILYVIQLVLSTVQVAVLILAVRRKFLR